MEKSILPHAWGLNTLNKEGLWGKGYEASFICSQRVTVKGFKDQRHNPLTERAS